MAFDSKKFLAALLSDQPQQSAAVDFAKFMAANSFSMPYVNEAAIARQQQEEEKEKAERAQGVLSKTFELLLAPMHTVQNSIVDITDPNQSLGEKIGNVGSNIGAGYLNVQNPLLEILSPGFEAPFEDKIQKYVEKENNEYHGTGPMTGSRMLEMAGWEPDSTVGKVGKAVAGFGVDVALDPLTYLSGGLSAVAKGAGRAASKDFLEKAAAKSVPSGSAEAFTKPASQAIDLGSSSPIQSLLKPSTVPETASIMPKGNFVEPLKNLDLTPIPPSTGFKLSAAKAAKNNPESVTMKFAGKLDVNPNSVKQAIDDIATQGPLTQKVILSEVTGDLANVATDTAEKYFAKMGKTEGGVVRGAALNPANQANLYNSMYKAAAKFLEKNPQVRRGGPELPRNQRFLRERAAEMTKLAETHLRTKYGVQGQAWDGSGLSISNVLEHLGDNRVLDEHVTSILKAFKYQDSSVIKNPVAQKAFEQAIAERSLKTGVVARGILDDYSKLAATVKESYSPSAYLRWKKTDSLKNPAFSASLAGLSSKEVDRVVDFAKNHVDVADIEHLEPYQILNSLSSKMIQEIARGNIDATLMEKVNKAIVSTLQKTPKQLSQDITGYGVADAFLTRFSTWAGRAPDSKHLAASGYGALEWAARSRAKWFSHQIASHTKEEVNQAFYLAQNRLSLLEDVAATEGKLLGNARTRALAAKISDYFENITASSMIKYQDLGGSPVIRSMATMADIDKQLAQLGSKFRFKDYAGRKSNTLGTPRDYSGGNWLSAWENVDPTKLGQEPMNFLYDLDLAVERVMTEYAVIDDFVTRFGRRVGDSDFDALHHRTVVPHHRIAGDLKFNKEIANQFQRLMRDMETGPWMPKNKALREWVRATSTWKRGVTIYNLSHHIRNLIGDSWLMWMAGHNDPRAFANAKKIIHSQRAHYNEVIKDPSLERLQGLLSKEEFGYSKTTGMTPILRRNGADITADEIYSEMMQRGLLASANQIEDIVGMTPYFAGKAGEEATGVKGFLNAPLGGKAHKLATQTAEYREHFVRIAHFSSAVNKGLNRTVAAQLKKAHTVADRRAILENVYESATREVRKWHPDGRDLTQFEQSTMRNIIPFYAWQRKSLPLLLEGFMKRPAKITAYPKGMYALQQALGIESPGPADSFPIDQIYPNFMTASGIGPIGDPESDNPVARFFGSLGRNYIDPVSGQEKGYTVINPSNPFQDFLGKTLGMGTRESLTAGGWSMLHPAMSLPIQGLTNETPIGAPISESEHGEGWAPWALSNVPIASMLQRVLEVGEDKSPTTEPGMDTQSIINMLTALGIQGSGQYKKSAEFDAKDFARQQMENR